jgi:hypothetical protein
MPRKFAVTPSSLFPLDCPLGVGEMIGMVVRVEFGCAFIGVPEPPGDLVQIHASLRKPSAAGVPQHMRRDISHAGPRASRLE